MAFYSVAGLAASNFGITGAIGSNASLATIYAGSSTTSTAVTIAQAGSSVELIGMCEFTHDLGTLTAGGRIHGIGGEASYPHPGWGDFVVRRSLRKAFSFQEQDALIVDPRHERIAIADVYKIKIDFQGSAESPSQQVSEPCVFQTHFGPISGIELVSGEINRLSGESRLAIGNDNQDDRKNCDDNRGARGQIVVPPTYQQCRQPLSKARLFDRRSNLLRDHCFFDWLRSLAELLFRKDGPAQQSNPQ
jgi:hypothetical protein